MKKSKPKYNFPDEVRELFIFNHACWICHRTDRGVEADHITGRTSELSTSGLNLAPLCRSCHQNKTSHDKPKLLQKTLTYLLSQDYNLTDKDAQFYEKNKRLYINQA